VKKLFRSGVKHFDYNEGFSVICVFNSREKLNRYILASLQGQSVPFEFIGIDNRTGSK
jgi:hypothetical protein